MPRGDRGELKIPRLEGEALEWVETALSIGMPYANTVRAFMDSFPEYLEPKDDDAERLSDDEAFAILKERFSRMRRDTRRVSYHNVKAKKETLKKFLDCIPVASPLIRLVELEKMRQDPSLKHGDVIKMLAAARQEADYLMPRETTKTPFSGVGLPDLPIAKVESDTEPDTETRKVADPFGGAITKNVDTG